MRANELNQTAKNIGVECRSLRTWLTQIRKSGRPFDAREAFEETHQLNRRFANHAARIQLASDAFQGPVGRGQHGVEGQVLDEHRRARWHPFQLELMTLGPGREDQHS